MKILVLGGCGFIGSHLVERLIRERHHVRIFDRVNVSVDNIRSVMDKVDLCCGDFLDKWAVDEALDGCEIVTTLQDIELYFQDCQEPDFVGFSPPEHGRIETRKI